MSTPFASREAHSQSIPPGERGAGSLAGLAKEGERGIPSFPRGSRSGEWGANPCEWLVLRFPARAKGTEWAVVSAFDGALRRRVERCPHEAVRTPHRDLSRSGNALGRGGVIVLRRPVEVLAA